MDTVNKLGKKKANKKTPFSLIPFRLSEETKNYTQGKPEKNEKNTRKK